MRSGKDHDSELKSRIKVAGALSAPDCPALLRSALESELD
jgi:hypothetical protein